MSKCYTCKSFHDCCYNGMIDNHCGDYVEEGNQIEIFKDCQQGKIILDVIKRLNTVKNVYVKADLNCEIVKVMDICITKLNSVLGCSLNE